MKTSDALCEFSVLLREISKENIFKKNIKVGTRYMDQLYNCFRNHMHYILGGREAIFKMDF